MFHRSRLPEADFGKVLAKQGLNDPPSITYNGMMVMLKAIFGEQSLPEVCFRVQLVQWA